MHKSLLVLILFVFFLAVPCFAENGKSSDPVLSASPGKSIIGRSLPPGTYRVVPDLRPGQHEASIGVTLVEIDPGKPQISDQLKTGKVTEPVKTDISQTELQKKQTGKVTKPVKTSKPQVKTQKKQVQDKKQDEPSGTGPEYDCEYGLPRRDGANCEIQLTPGDLPAGWRIDDSFNMNKACVVNQWIMHGPDRKNRIELSISVWNERAEKYYNWKHGMLGTGQYNQTDLSIGTKQLYVEEKAGCNKQLIAQVGNYLVEIHRPPVEGLTQQTDPISREQFVAVAKACENRIEAVAGIPAKQMLNDNPSEFRWGTAVWPVSFVNGMLKVRGAGKPKWGTEWVVVDTGIKSYRGQGTGAGPVVTYTKDNKRWTVAMLNHDTGAKGNVRIFNTRVSIMKAGEYGATLRVRKTCYDYSWGHLEEIDCKTGQFIHVGKTKKKPGVEEPGKVQKIPSVKKPGKTGKEPKKVQPDTGKNIITIPKTSRTDDMPDWTTSFMAVGERAYDCAPFYMEYGDVIPIRAYFWRVSKFFPIKAVPVNEFGEYKKGHYHATTEGNGKLRVKSVTIQYVPKGGGAIKTGKISLEELDRELWYRYDVPIHVNPPLVPANKWPKDDDFKIVYGSVSSGPGNFPDDLEVCLIQDEKPGYQVCTKTSFDDSTGFNFWFTVKELRHLPRGTYTFRLYKAGGRGKPEEDLWNRDTVQIALPPMGGVPIIKDNLAVIPASEKWKGVDYKELRKKLGIVGRDK